MSSEHEQSVNLTPQKIEQPLLEDLRLFVAGLPQINSEPSDEELLEHERSVEDALTKYIRIIHRKISDRGARLALLGAAHVFADLARLTWMLQAGERGGPILGQRPSVTRERNSRRRQLLTARAEVLRDSKTRVFVQAMERSRVWNEQAVSIYSVMADGRDLEKRLAAADTEGTDPPVRPFVQVVGGIDKCEQTGLSLGDMWRYFRLTWTNAPKSIPARQMRFLVRDAAAPFHPVIGIGELSGAAIRVGSRDRYIGWDADAMASWWASEPSSKFRSWLIDTVQSSRDELFLKDFETEGVIGGSWANFATGEVRDQLRLISKESRRAHEENQGQGRQVKLDPTKASKADWETAAVRPLFRSKRAERLAELIDLWLGLEPIRKDESQECLQAFMATSKGQRLASRVLRLAKSIRQGTAIADLTVCGAVAPYNELVGGKLVALVAGCPEIVTSYENRYGGRASIIASSMAGRPIVREAKLVLVSTTGLYGIRPSQYDRLSMSLEREDGKEVKLKYAYLREPADEGKGSAKGKTAGWGTFQFGKKTTRALAAWLTHDLGRKRVSYEYGEGASPRLRLLREGLEALGFDPTELLVHQLRKTMYVCSLVENPRKYLLGFEKEPRYHLTQRGGVSSIQQIATFWWQRWAQKRSQRSDILDRIRLQTTIHPVMHGARVELSPEDEEQIALFDTW